MTVKYSDNKLWSIRHYTERYAQSASARQPLVLLSGWSCDSHIFEWLIPGLAQHFVIVSAELNTIPDDMSFGACCEELAQSLFAEFTQPVNFLGWSLGGNVALELANTHPQLCANLCLLATTPVFVNKDNVEGMMPEAVFKAFQEQVFHSADKGLKQFDRLMMAASDKHYAKPLRAALKDYRQQQISQGKVWPIATLNNGLEFLAQLDQRDCIQHLSEKNIAIQAVLFADDALVNVSASEFYHDAVIVEGASHLGFLTHTETVYQTCLSMLSCSVQALDDKQAIATSFSNAAMNYDKASDVQQRIAANVFSRLASAIDNANTTPEYIVDAGCGTGLWTNKLSNLAPHVTGVDLADGMLTFAKSHYSSVKHWLQADLESMPLIPEQSDYIFSSLAVQWCDDFSAMLAHWLNVLKPGGEVVLATLATDTLYELADCFSQLDSQAHVNDFYSYQQLLSFVENSGFELKYSAQVKEIQTYKTAVALMHDLKAIGAQTVKTKGGVVKPKPMTKSQLSLVSSSYEKYRTEEGLLPATYDVIYLHLKKPL